MRSPYCLGSDRDQCINPEPDQLGHKPRQSSDVALRRTPETINRYFELFDKLTPEDIQKVAAKYLVEKNRTAVTLTGKGASSK